jgi:transposase
MHYRLNFDTDLEISSLRDLPKLKTIMEALDMKPNISKIARDLGCDRRTAKRYYEGDIPTGERNKPSYLDNYYELIFNLLSPESKQVFYYKASLWRYLVREGILDCPESTFRQYVSNRPALQAYFDKQKSDRPNGPKTTVRFETGPGEQAQLDWKENIKYLTNTGDIIILNILVLVLSYSRLKLYALTTSRIQSVLISYLVEFFEIIGGVPCNLLIDNLSTVMDDPRTPFHPGTINAKFYQFSKDFAFEVRPCLVGRAQTKGKVESVMKLLDDIHAYQGLLDYAGLQELVKKLNNEANLNVNQSTGKAPLGLFQQEKGSLLALPGKQIVTLYKIPQEHVKVSKDLLVSYRGNKYSVPSSCAGKTLFYEEIDGELLLYDNTDLVARHPVSSRKLNYINEHYLQHLSLTQPHAKDIETRARDNLKKIGDFYNANK